MEHFMVRKARINYSHEFKTKVALTVIRGKNTDLIK